MPNIQRFGGGAGGPAYTTGVSVSRNGGAGDVLDTKTTDSKVVGYGLMTSYMYNSGKYGYVQGSNDGNSWVNLVGNQSCSAESSMGKGRRYYIGSVESSYRYFRANVAGWGDEPMYVVVSVAVPVE